MPQLRDSGAGRYKSMNSAKLSKYSASPVTVRRPSGVERDVRMLYRGWRMCKEKENGGRNSSCQTVASGWAVRWSVLAYLPQSPIYCVSSTSTKHGTNYCTALIRHNEWNHFDGPGEPITGDIEAQLQVFDIMEAGLTSGAHIRPKTIKLPKTPKIGSNTPSCAVDLGESMG